MSFLKAIFHEKEAAAPAAESLLGELLSTLREGAVIVGRDSTILASNHAAYEYLGRGNGQLVGKRLTELLRDLGVHEAFQGAIEEGLTSNVDLTVIGVETKKYEVRVSPFNLTEDRAAIMYFHDVTHVDRLERVRQEFLSNVSHELRTPLTSIIAFAETLEDGAIHDPENSLRFLGVIQRNAERMHRLIDDILELTSIESGHIQIETRSCGLRGMVDEVMTSLSEKAQDHGVELINEVSAEMRVEADPIRLEQMLVNLVDNGIKFNAEGGRVTVSHESSTERDIIKISDTGEGIAAEHLPRLFERFYRVDKARSREIGGTGLGLAITKHLAILHGGEVSVASTIGAGTVFSIELPRR